MMEQKDIKVLGCIKCGNFINGKNRCRLEPNIVIRIIDAKPRKICKSISLDHRLNYE